MKRVLLLAAHCVLPLLAFATFFLALSMIMPVTLGAQDSHRTLTNADVLNMAKSGIGDKTIILAIQQSPTKFDTSPEALIELKRGACQKMS